MDVEVWCWRCELGRCIVFMYSGGFALEVIVASKLEQCVADK
jgi:hypothetical protein